MIQPCSRVGSHLPAPTGSGVLPERNGPLIGGADRPRLAVLIHRDGEDYHRSDPHTAHLSRCPAADSDADVRERRHVTNRDIDMTVMDLGADRSRSGHDGCPGNDGDDRTAYEGRHGEPLRSVDRSDSRRLAST
jgi:hypothetical protein